MARNWTERDVEDLLRKAVGVSVPDVYQQVSGAQVDPLLNPDHIVPTRRPPRRRWGRAVGALCAMLLLVLGLGLFLQLHTAAIVAIGEEPDVELSVNRFGRVLDARGRSEAGEAILAGLSLKGEGLDDAVEQVAWSMADRGYLDGSDVPVSVDGGDWKYNRELEEEAQEALEDVLEDWGGGGHAVIAPVDPEDDGTGGDDGLSGAAPSAVPTPAPVTTATPQPRPSAPAATTGGSGLLSSEEAMATALAHAGVSASDATFDKVELEEEDGTMVYQLEFCGGGVEYDYKVDAYTGAVRKAEQKGSDSGSGSTSISAAEAEAIAFRHAGVTADQVSDREVELEEDNGRRYYKVEFQRGETDYEYEIDAATGAIRKAEQD